MTIENINKIISKYNLPKYIDLFSIDIDSNDLWVWSEIRAVLPRVVVIEYNATWPPPVSISIPCKPNATWNGTNYFGASLAALCKVGEKKGYALVGCNLVGVNAFFVRKDLLGDHFLKPGDVAEHYEPARHVLAKLLPGHKTGIGEVVTIP